MSCIVRDRRGKLAAIGPNPALHSTMAAAFPKVAADSDGESLQGILHLEQRLDPLVT